MACLHLGIEAVYSSALNLGEGNIQTQHGLLPVPAPATAELIKGAKCYSSGITAEITTPTGAAIITTLTNSFGSLPRMKIEKVGYGTGSKDFPFPNLLRVMLGSDDQGYEQDIVTLIETNIDDSNPQVFDYLMERLFEEGALMERKRLSRQIDWTFVNLICHRSCLTDFSGE